MDETVGLLRGSDGLVATGLLAGDWMLTAERRGW